MDRIASRDVAQLFVVRHADAGHRDEHRADEERPLSERGWRQAEGLADQLEEREVRRLLASPFVRCLQTLEPLAKRLGLTVEADDRLAEGRGAAGALAVAEEVRGSAAVLCSHGDVIPDLLEHLLAHGTKLKDELRWQKASTWELTWDGHDLSKGRYHPPPA